jgi:biopolymer transport protein ExbD
MSLERFEMKRNIFHPLLAVGFINFVLMVVLLIMSTTIFAKPSGVQMEFPSLKEGGSAPGGVTPLLAGTRGVVITVTGENVIYIDGRVVTLHELRRFLAQGNFRRDALMIKVDSKASMGRVADILDLCRGISGASVNVSTIL